MQRKVGRRQFVKVVGLGAIGTAVAAKFGFGSAVEAQESTNLESAITQGILILGENEATPDWVRPVEQSLVLHGGPQQAFFEHMTASELAGRVDPPIYELSEVPEGYESDVSVLAYHVSGFVHFASVNYTLKPSPGARPMGTISVVANPPGSYPEPLPLHPMKLGNGVVSSPRAVSYVPAGGYEMIGDRDSAVFWLDNRVLHSLRILDYGSSPEAVGPADSAQVATTLRVVERTQT